MTRRNRATSMTGSDAYWLELAADEVRTQQKWADAPKALTRRYREGYVANFQKALWAEIKFDTEFRAVYEIILARATDENVRALQEAFDRHATEIAAQLDRMEGKIDFLVAKAGNAGIDEEIIIELARPIARDVEDADQALKELERAVAIAKAVEREGAMRANTSDFVEEVLKRVAALSRNGAFDEAAQEASAAYEHWREQEAERQEREAAAGLKILNTGLELDMLRRDPKGAAARIDLMIRHEGHADQDAHFHELRRRWGEWYERGRDKGLNFDLEVSIELARLSAGFANGPDQKGTALNDWGIALRELGIREIGTARLEEAVKSLSGGAGRAHPRARSPSMGDDPEQSGRTPCAELGCRESGTARLEEAVEAYRAALKERTRERVPLQWAMTQNNLGVALPRSWGAAKAGRRGWKRRSKPLGRRWKNGPALLGAPFQ